MQVNFDYSGVYDEMLCSLMEAEPRKSISKDVAAFEKFWKKYEVKIFSAIVKHGGLAYSNDVACYIVSHLPELALSRPLTLRYIRDHKRLAYVLIHEILHELFSQNKGQVVLYIDTMFAKMDLSFRHHVPVLMLQQKVVTAVFGKRFFLAQRKADFDLPIGLVWHTVEPLMPHFRSTLLEFLKHDGLDY